MPGLALSWFSALCVHLEHIHLSVFMSHVLNGKWFSEAELLSQTWLMLVALGWWAPSSSWFCNSVLSLNWPGGHPSTHRPKTPYVSFICWGTVAVVGSYYCKSPFPAALSLVTHGVLEVESAHWPGQQGTLQPLMPKSQGLLEDKGFLPAEPWGPWWHLRPLLQVGKAYSFKKDVR